MVKILFNHPFNAYAVKAIDSIRIHLLCCIHGGEHMATHDALRNYFISIARDVGFHVLHG